MGNLSLYILLFLLGTVIVSADKSASSCEENNNKELVCSREVLEAIQREQKGLPPLPKSHKVADFEVTKAPPGAPVKEASEETGGGGDEEYEEGDYYDEDEYDE